MEFMYKLINPEMGGMFKKMARQDKSGRSIRVGDRVSTNIGNGKVTGFTKCFVRVSLDRGFSILRKERNIVNLTGLDFKTEYISDNDYYIFYDSTNRNVKVGNFVNTDKGLGKVVDITECFLKIQLTNGKIILRRKVTIVD